MLGYALLAIGAFLIGMELTSTKKGVKHERNGKNRSDRSGSDSNRGKHTNDQRNYGGRRVTDDGNFFKGKSDDSGNRFSDDSACKSGADAEKRDKAERLKTEKAKKEKIKKGRENAKTLLKKRKEKQKK